MKGQIQIGVKKQPQHPNLFCNNEIDETKKEYILSMRKLCGKDLVKPSGSLNLPYFKLKKGQYWNEEAQEALIKAVIEFGAFDIKSIMKKYFSETDKTGKVIRSQTEVRLRISKLLRVYDLEGYKDMKFNSLEDIKKEAQENFQKA